MTDHQSTAAMEQLRPSIDDLDLMTLPSRLDDTTLARVEAISLSPLPDPLPCSDRHFDQCLRIMLACVPKRNLDDVSGELFIAAYRRQLGCHPRDAISFLADRATSSLKWFPTIAECLEIIADWRRDDDEARRRHLARKIALRERSARRADQPIIAYECPALTQADVDQLSDSLVSIGIKCGALIRDGDGNVMPAP